MRRGNRQNLSSAAAHGAQAVALTVRRAKRRHNKYLWDDFPEQINHMATCSHTATELPMLMNWLFRFVCFATCLCWGFMELCH